MRDAAVAGRGDHLPPGVRGFKVHANLGYGIPWNDSQLAVFSRQLKILGEYYLQHPDVPRVSLLDLNSKSFSTASIPSKSIAAPERTCTSTTWTAGCIPATCSRRWSYPGRGPIWPLKLDFSKPEHLVDPKCWQCCGRELCPTCYGFNYKLSGDPAIRDPVLCRMFKVQLLENCRFEAARLRGKRGAFSREDCKKAKAVLEIHQNLIG